MQKFNLGEVVRPTITGYGIPGIIFSIQSPGMFFASRLELATRWTNMISPKIIQLPVYYIYTLVPVRPFTFIEYCKGYGVPSKPEYKVFYEKTPEESQICVSEYELELLAYNWDEYKAGFDSAESIKEYWQKFKATSYSGITNGFEPLDS